MNNKELVKTLTLTYNQDEMQLNICNNLWVMYQWKIQHKFIVKEQMDLFLRHMNMYRSKWSMDDFYKKMENLLEKLEGL